MNMVRFGPIYVNFDRVTMIRDLSDSAAGGAKLVRLEFEEGHVIDVTAHASDLLQWAELHATDPATSSTNP